MIALPPKFVAFDLETTGLSYTKDEIIEILDILKEKGKTKYWLYIQLGLSYQNFNKLVNNQTKSIKFDNIKSLCDILDCTPNDLFYEYYK